MSSALAVTVELHLVSLIIAWILAAIVGGAEYSNEHRLARPAALARMLSVAVPTPMIVLGLLIMSRSLCFGPQNAVVFVDERHRCLTLALILGLAIGSSGYLAASLSPVALLLRSEAGVQLTAAGLPSWRRMLVATREESETVLTVAGPRMTHHLHHTVLAALIPIPSLFGEARTSALVDGAIGPILAMGGVYVLISAAQRGLVAWLIGRLKNE